jgi:hypothetical protein
MTLHRELDQTSRVLLPRPQWVAERPQSGSVLPSTPLRVNPSPRRLSDLPLTPAVLLKCLLLGQELSLESP